ncbi:hypothetical protein K4G60_g1134 [Candida parapsilosis]|nr:hypothetical protein K4G60_g1134 [Candida parapsilosis]KAI5907106.1 hypothetical protein K4G61_g766 [Candida parapsilosis]
MTIRQWALNKHHEYPEVNPDSNSDSAEDIKLALELSRTDACTSGLPVETGDIVEEDNEVDEELKHALELSSIEH